MASSIKFWTVEVRSPSGHSGVYQVDDALVKLLGEKVFASPAVPYAPLIKREHD